MKRFPASLNCAHRATLVNLMGRVPLGGGSVVIGADEDKALRDLAGAIDYYAAQPGGCDSPSYPVDMKPEILQGDYSRKLWQATADVIVVFPFKLPPTGTIHIAQSEFNGQPWARLMTISTTPGDLSAPVQSAGKTPDIYLTGGIDFPAGVLLYANTILTDVPTVPNSGGSGISIVWP